MLTPDAGDRLRKLVPLLSSDRPGEVVATAAAIGRTLEACGASWHDLAEAAAQAAEPDDPADIFAFVAVRVARPSERLWIERLARFYAQRGFLSERQMEILADIAGRARHAA